MHMTFFLISQLCAEQENCPECNVVEEGFMQVKESENLAHALALAQPLLLIFFESPYPLDYASTKDVVFCINLTSRYFRSPLRQRTSE